MGFQKVLERELLRNNMSQLTLARRLGVTKQCVTNWKYGRRSPEHRLRPKLVRIWKLKGIEDLEIESTFAP